MLLKGFNIILCSFHYIITNIVISIVNQRLKNSVDELYILSMKLKLALCQDTCISKRSIYYNLHGLIY